jgi:hypothetical protein
MKLEKRLGKRLGERIEMRRKDMDISSDITRDNLLA